jgi:hypothetical protein
MGMSVRRLNRSNVHRFISLSNVFGLTITIVNPCKMTYGSVKTATVVIPSFLHEAITRHAISPRFAIKTRVIFGLPLSLVGRGGIFRSFPVFRNGMLAVVACLDVSLARRGKQLDSRTVVDAGESDTINPGPFPRIFRVARLLSRTVRISSANVLLVLRRLSRTSALKPKTSALFKYSGLREK